MKSLLGLLAVIVLSFAVFSCGTGSFKDESFYVRGNCEMCKDRLESGVKTLTGVAQAKYNIKDEVLKVTYDTTLTNRAVIEKQCANLGHGTQAYPMNEEKHDALPECCKVSHNGGKH
ncbi:MAG: cation-transporting ATPase [Bacteroidota bacterium]|jgi:Cu(I)/Ag(I) efflux system membrane fusion protein|nr:cation-transporting ATPase [Bacteroidota bacterium]